MKLTPITNPVALRLDTTVGTRIFAGNTMIHGDTGWRDFKSLIENGLFNPEGVVGGFQTRVRRFGNNVQWSLRFRPGEEFVGTRKTIHILSGNMPVGFRELPTSFTSFATHMDGTGAQIALSNDPGSASLSIYTNSNWRDVSYGVTGGYMTNESWPATLPGLPY